MNRVLLSVVIGLALCIVGLVLASGDERPSPVALAHGHPPGPYSDAEFSISDDAVVMVLSVQHGDRSMRLYGDGRLELRAGDGEIYTRRLGRPRMLDLFRSAVDRGLAEYDHAVVMQELAGARCPEGAERITASLRFTSYNRNGASGGVERAGICAPETFPQVVQSRALADLAKVLEEEIIAARREGSIEVQPVNFKDAMFTLSSDPDQLIFSFRRQYGFMYSRSMRLYGDGRLELRHIEKGDVTREGFDRELSYPEMVALVRSAVDHGFAEWDADALGSILGIRSVSADAGGAGGELHLESYRRGSYSRDNLSRSFRFGDVRTARERSADVLQVQGLVSVLQVLDDQFELAHAVMTDPTVTAQDPLLSRPPLRNPRRTPDTRTVPRVSPRR